MYIVKIIIIYYQAVFVSVLFECKWNVIKTDSNIHLNVCYWQIKFLVSLSRKVRGALSEQRELARQTEKEVGIQTTSWNGQALSSPCKSQRAVENRKRWRKLVVKSQRPSRLRDR